MGRSFFRQAIQVAESVTYDGSLAPGATLQTAAANIEDDLNALRSYVHLLKSQQGGNWYDDLVAPVNFENGAKRSVDENNQALHDLERKRVLVDNFVHIDITVPASQNFVILGLSELPSNTTAAVGAVTTLGTVAAAHTGTFGQHSLDEVAGAASVSPKNLGAVVDSVTHDPITSGGQQVYALLQTENATDGHTMTGTTPNRAQLSFVRLNATGDDLEAVPVADIENLTIHYTVRERKALEDFNEEDFLTGIIIDLPTGATVDRQTAYDNQGTTPVDLLTNAILDLEGAGVFWKIRDDLEADLFTVTEGSAGGTSTVQLGAAVDTFDNDAAINDFANELRVDTAGERIDIGVTAGHIESTGANDLHIQSAAELWFDDVNQVGSTWVGTDGVKLSEDTTEWSTYRTNFGEVSLLNALNQAFSASGGVTRTKGVATVIGGNYAADTNMTGAGGSPNLDTQLPDYSTVTFVDDVDVYMNGQLLINGVDAAANNDVYPGVSAANGDLRFEFATRGTGSKPDQITMIVWGA